MIRVEDLVKKYGAFTAVDGVSLHVAPGEIHGFLGPNGAGKTTTIRMIAGLLKPTRGHIVIDGHDLEREPERAKAALGFIPDRPFLYEKLTATEFLRFHAGLYGIEGDGLPERLLELLALFELVGWKDELVESFSHGMKQRLVMCAAFRATSRKGVAILMSTHTLEVAEEMCDRISIILGGRILARGTVEELRALAGGEDEKLTPVFLKLTGGSGLQEIDEAV
jgi:ABC-2 type transport system ATP-binding protein